MNALLADPSMRVFAICAAILVIKMLVTANLTGTLRTIRRVYATPEDYQFFGREPVATRDEQIERSRRAHQNDLENILPFFAIGFLYALTGPSYTVAWWLFVIFTVGRIAHTIVYMAGLQPWRTIAFAVAGIPLYLMTFITLASLL
jgi:glutathione S-transferase